MDLYHVLNRGVEKRMIFMNDADRARFIHDMYEFNDTKPAPDTYRTMWELRSPTLNRERERIVDIHGWCLMGNHYHLLISERAENGLSHFLRKLNVGYAMYFNEKYRRSGTLFQGRTKKILIDSDAHFLHILHYIHLNPLDFLSHAKNWRSGRIRSADLALQYLEKYKWSSYRDYCGVRNFPSILSTSLFHDVFIDYRATLSTYLRNMDTVGIQDLTLEMY